MLVFQVIVCEKDSGEKELLSFVLPNQALPENVDLKSYFVSIDTIERASGLLLFNKIHRNLFTKVNGKKV